MREPLTAAQQRLIDFEDNSLRDSFCRIILEPDVNSGDETAERPGKRRRLSSKASNGHHNFSTTPAMRRTHEILNTSPTTGIGELCNTALSLIVEMPDDDQCIIIRAIGQIVCINAHTWITPKGRCSVCDYEQQRRRSESLMEEMLCEQIFQTIRDLLKLLQAQRSTKPRVATMMTAKRLLTHTCIPKHLDMRDSLLGQWCLQAFRSSLRDLRISAGRTLMLFLQDGVDDKYLRQNRVLAFDLLQGLSEKSGLALQETCILTWGWIAKISSEDEINIVLLRLVEYLGHNNPLISALAYDELLRVTNHSSAAAMRMFVPYWRTLAITIVKDLHSRPQISQRICDLLNVNVNQFLQLTQFYTIPYLILTKKRDILQKIADGCEPKLSICALCMGHTQLAAILANLLLQPWSDLEPMVMSLLCFASPEFNDTDFQGLIRTEPMLTAFELLKIAGDEEDGKDGRVGEELSKNPAMINMNNAGPPGCSLSCSIQPTATWLNYTVYSTE
jgi:serine/threonine-protein kinase ATR